MTGEREDFTQEAAAKSRERRLMLDLAKNAAASDSVLRRVARGNRVEDTEVYHPNLYDEKMVKESEVEDRKRGHRMGSEEILEGRNRRE
jgi:hypothetical protein